MTSEFVASERETDSLFSAVILKTLFRPLWRKKVSFPAWPKPAEDAPASFLWDAI